MTRRPINLPDTLSSFGAVSGLLLLLLLGLFYSYSLGAQSDPIGKRPSSFPEFAEGVTAFERAEGSAAEMEQWEEVARIMRAALEKWPEDGKLARLYGRRFVAYLPRYYLGAALYRSGCYKAALEQFENSVLRLREIANAKKHRDQFKDFKLKSESFVDQGIVQDETANCSTWNESGESE